MRPEKIYQKAIKTIEKQGRMLLSLSQKALLNSSKKVALAPGTLVYVGEERHEAPQISLISYNADHLEEKVLGDIKEAFSYKAKEDVTWVNIDGVHQVSLIEEIGNHYNIHPLVLEDIVHTNQRPKVEEHDHYLYIILKMFYPGSGEKGITCEQVSLLVGKNFVISFQEKPGDVFGLLRNRIKAGKGRIRIGGADYLAYAIIDAIVDHYFVVLERTGEALERLEDEINHKPETSTLSAVHRVKRELMFLRKSIWPLREVVNQLSKNDFDLIQEETLPYLKDVYDHTIQVVETIESFRDTAGGLQDLYMTVMSNRMNEVMKVLTIIATLFIPPTFIAGIYGMNFEHMPELHVQTGYFFVLGIMVTSIVGMLIYFKCKKWF